MQEGDHELDYDLSTLSPEEYLNGNEYVVIRGYEPGPTNKLGAILRTRLLDGSVVVRMNSEVAATCRWRQELTAGNRVFPIGTASEEERAAFTEVLRERLMRTGSIRPTVLSPRLDMSPSQSSSVYDSPSSAAFRYGIKRQSTPPTSATPPPTPRQAASTVVAPPATAGPSASGNTVLVERTVVNWKPPSHRGDDWRPRNLPSNELRGTRSKWAWYVAKKCRIPGIYASWDDVEDANGGPEPRPITKGHNTYEEALNEWLAIRGTNAIQHYPA